MSKNYGYTAGNLLDYLYHQKYYKLIGTDLSRQTNTSISQHINFIGRLEKDEGAAMFFIDEKKKNNKFFCKFIGCNRIIQIMEY